MSTVDEPSQHDTAHTGQSQTLAPGSHDPQVGSAGVGYQCSGPTPGRGPAVHTVVVIQACLDAAKEVLSSDDRTNRVLRLLLPVLYASVVIIIGAAMIAAGTLITLIEMESGLWWKSLAALSIAAIGSLGTALVRARRRRDRRLFSRRRAGRRLASDGPDIGPAGASMGKVEVHGRDPLP